MTKLNEELLLSYFAEKFEMFKYKEMYINLYNGLRFDKNYN